jgi:hypothetical protein
LDAGRCFRTRAGSSFGEEGTGHVIDLLIEETQAALGRLGAHAPAKARSVVIRHNGALQF